MTRRSALTLSLALVLAACSQAAAPNGDGTAPANTTGAGSGPQASTTDGGGTAVPSPTGGTLTCWTAPAAAGDSGITFSDQTEAMGLVQPFVGMYGHSAIWGDFDGDDRPDLYVGTFADRDAADYMLRGAQGPSPDRLVMTGAGSFTLASNLPDMFSRTSGGAVADLDVDGDLDLVVSRNYDDDSASAPPSQVLRNDGGILVPLDGGGLPTQFGGRSVGVLDFDRDGLPDLFIAEDSFSGGSGVLLRNRGGLTFEDATQAAGLPPDLHGLGVSVADLNGDGSQDLFVSGSNRLFVANGDGTFREADSTVFRWQTFSDEDLVAGSSVADVNRDGLLDIVVGQHFNSTVDQGNKVPVRLYLNRGADGSGAPAFEDVTEAAGLVGLPTKAPHVELNDFDNDGWPDLYTTASSTEGSRPAVFRHEGLEGDVPRFSAPGGLGSPQYWVAGPSSDVDRDGRLDVFMVEWEPALPSLLMHNESGSGHWLEVSVGPEEAFGLGWRVEVYRPGGIGDPASLLGAREITVTQGYSAGVAPTAHFGLGEETTVDVRLTPPGEGPSDLAGVAADQHIRFPSGCA
jgi:hypothetical protein